METDLELIFSSDFHVHTAYSPCARDKTISRPSNMLKRAAEKGIWTVGFTDHFSQFPDRAIPYFRECGKDMIFSLKSELDDTGHGPEVLIGCEADLYALDNLSVDHSMLMHLDYIMVSASHFHLDKVQRPESSNRRVVGRHCLSFLKKALSFQFVSIIAHPFFTPKRALGDPRLYLETIEDSALEETAEIAVQNNVAMEVNSWLAIDEIYFEAVCRAFQIFKKAGVRFSYGSDAHEPERLGMQGRMPAVISEIGLTPDDFISREELVRKSEMFLTGN